MIIVVIVIIIVVVIIIIGSSSSSSSSSSIIIIIPSIRGYTCTPAERGSLALFPVRVGGLRTISLCHIAASEYEASTAITEPLVEQIVAQTHELLDDRAIENTAAAQCNRREKNARLRDNHALPEQTKRERRRPCCRERSWLGSFQLLMWTLL